MAKTRVQKTRQKLELALIKDLFPGKAELNSSSTQFASPNPSDSSQLPIPNILPSTSAATPSPAQPIKVTTASCPARPIQPQNQCIVGAANQQQQQQKSLEIGKTFNPELESSNSGGSAPILSSSSTQSKLNKEPLNSADFDSATGQGCQNSTVKKVMPWLFQ